MCFLNFEHDGRYRNGDYALASIVRFQSGFYIIVTNACQSSEKELGIDWGYVVVALRNLFNVFVCNEPFRVGIGALLGKRYA